MNRCTSSSQSGCLFNLARGSCRYHRQYPQHESPTDPLNWYIPSDCQTSEWSGQLGWGLPWLHPSRADQAARQFFHWSQQLCCCYWGLHAILGCLAFGWVCHCEQQPAYPLQQQQQQWHHHHHQSWEYRIRRWMCNCRGCDVGWRWGMVSVIGLRSLFVCYCNLCFVDISYL